MTLCFFRHEVVEHREQIGLTDQHEIGGAEHHRVLGRFVVTLGHRQQGDIAVLAEIEAGGADQVADVLDE